MSEPATTRAVEDLPETAEGKERRYWLYVPGEGAGKWEEFQTAGIMALNWDRIGDPMRYPDEEAILEALESSYGDWGGRPRGAARMIRDFAHTIRPGDVVYARALRPRSSGAASSAQGSATTTSGPPTAACTTSSGRISVPGRSTAGSAQ